MSKRIQKSDFLEGLSLCESNALRLFLLMLEKVIDGDLFSAFLYGVVSFEEFVKGFMILESWDEEYISYRKWKNKMIQHKEKLRRGKYLIDKNIIDSAQTLIDKYNVPKEIFINIPEDKVDDVFVDKITNDKNNFLYVNYNHNENMWIPIKEVTYKNISEIRDLIVSSWLLFNREKSELKIKTHVKDKHAHDISQALKQLATQLRSKSEKYPV